ncbi:hypothetical protein MNEG_4585, partial [Monoraphidium neglectum]
MRLHEFRGDIEAHGVEAEEGTASSDAFNSCMAPDSCANDGGASNSDGVHGVASLGVWKRNDKGCDCAGSGKPRLTCIYEDGDGNSAVVSFDGGGGNGVEVSVGDGRGGRVVVSLQSGVVNNAAAGGFTFAAPKQQTYEADSQSAWLGGGGGHGGCRTGDGDGGGDGGG